MTKLTTHYEVRVVNKFISTAKKSFSLSHFFQAVKEPELAAKRKATKWADSLPRPQESMCSWGQLSSRWERYPNPTMLDGMTTRTWRRQDPFTGQTLILIDMEAGFPVHLK